MPKKYFSNYTYIAYIDIWGFTACVIHDPGRADSILHAFYDFVEKEITESKGFLKGLVVSDSALLYEVQPTGKIKPFKLTLFEAVININRNCLLKGDFRDSKPFLLKTGISFGYLKYDSSSSVSDLQKGFIRGDGYLNAYSAAENVAQPGRVIMVRHSSDRQEDLIRLKSQFITKELSLSGKGYMEILWMLKNEEKSKIFEKKYAYIFGKDRLYNEITALFLETLNKKI